MPKFPTTLGILTPSVREGARYRAPSRTLRARVASASFERCSASMMARGNPFPERRPLLLPLGDGSPRGTVALPRTLNRNRAGGSLMPDLNDGESVEMQGSGSRPYV